MNSLLVGWRVHRANERAFKAYGHSDPEAAARRCAEEHEAAMRLLAKAGKIEMPDLEEERVSTRDVGRADVGGHDATW